MEMRSFLIGSLTTAIGNASGAQKRVLMDTMATYMEDIATQQAQREADAMTREQVRSKYLMSQKLKAYKRASYTGKPVDEFAVALQAALDAAAKSIADLMEG